jgi:plastocyanin
VDRKVIFAISVLASTILIPSLISNVTAESVPDWVKNTAKWYADGTISETEFLNAIKFLIEKEFIVLDLKTVELGGLIASEEPPKPKTMHIIIPHGNYDLANAGFYIPLNAEVNIGTTVVWVNDDAVLHTIQSQDDQGQVIGLFNSAPLKTGERFAYTFDEEGIYNYFCTLHPWRVGLVTVT